jgi:hypothetical protein
VKTDSPSSSAPHSVQLHHLSDPQVLAADPLSLSSLPPSPVDPSPPPIPAPSPPLPLLAPHLYLHPTSPSRRNPTRLRGKSSTSPAPKTSLPISSNRAITSYVGSSTPIPVVESLGRERGGTPRSNFDRSRRPTTSCAVRPRGRCTSAQAGQDSVTRQLRMEMYGVGTRDTISVEGDR